MVKFEDIQNNEEITNLIASSGDVLTAMNYTEHGFRHVSFVSHNASKVLHYLGYSEHLQELAKIAGYVHDIGNSINRKNHGISAAIMLYPILKNLGMDLKDVNIICSAVGNHEEEIGSVINEVSAALVIADKSDAHRTRVKKNKYDSTDIHDRVNYAIKKNLIEVDGQKREIKSKFYMDDTASIMEYFSIYLPRINMSENAAKFLNCTFKLYINDVLINSPRKMNSKEIQEVTKALPNDK